MNGAPAWDGVRRLWSLWDMLKIEGHALFGALNLLEKLEKIATGEPQAIYENAEMIEAMRGGLNDIIAQLTKLDTRLARKKAEAILMALKIAPRHEAAAVAAVISRQLEELRERIQQELEDRAIYFLSPPEAAMFEQGIGSFAPGIRDRFADMSTDLGEAAYCLALSRNTACIFHLMRAMEAAVQAIGAKLGVTIIDKNNVDLEWGKVVANVKNAVEAMPRGDERDQWSEVVTLLYHVKQCWRNSTMHPKQTYTSEEADEVRRAVNGFLRHLAKLV